MRENELFALLRTTLIAGLADMGVPWSATSVKQRYQPGTTGMDKGQNIGMMMVTSNRIGSMKRKELQPVAPATDFTHVERQWWESTIQISALCRLNPKDPDYLSKPTAMDIAKAASDILQGDKGLAALAIGGARPLRITSVRQLHFVNDSDQYEANPSFDITLSYVQTITATTPPVSTYEPRTAKV